MNLAIKVENVSKKYRLGTINRDMLYKDIQSWWAKMRGKSDPNAKISFIHQDRLEKGDEFWALRNINLEIKEGEIAGIIGRNGAGKSTLLKILSQITAPTEGKIHVKGRIASLLEVGTGFHPELTGRANVFLNGAILGMSRKEIKSKFDEIVNFADLDHFIDTPVKRYSSGMYVRLAFGVAAHLEPEILIIDEVLAVGDANFQKKCLGKMREVSKKDGRTVLFVSHNMAAIHHLCPRAILMQNGQLAEDGPSESVVTAYLNGMRLPQDNNAHIKSFDGNFSISHTILRNKAGNETNTFKPGETLEVEIHYDSKKTILAPFCWVSLSGSEGVLLGANMLLDGFRPTQMQGKGFIKVRFTNLPLLPQNSYFVHAGMRYNDAKTPIIPSGEIAHFNVTGSALESGFLSPNADTFLLKASGIIAEYEWELSTGEKFAFKPTFKN